MVQEKNVSIAERSGDGARFIYHHFIAPKSDTEDSRRKEVILNILLISSIVFSALLSCIAIRETIAQGASYAGVSPLIVIGWCFTFVVLFHLSRSGHPGVVTYALMIAYYLPTVSVMLKYGATPPQLVLMFALLVVIASVLIGTRFSFFVLAIVAVTMGTIHLLHIRGVVVPITDWRQDALSVSGDIVPPVITLLVIAVVSWLSNREIEKSLRRARRSEAELREERDNLERKVEERTRELKRAQMEQMCQLYRFAEFGKMSSGYFHDIANPLTAVSLSLERLKAQGVEELADTRIHFERALNAAKRMEDYIGAVKKQLQRQEDLKTFSPSEEIEQLIEIIGYKARKAGVAIRSRLDTEIRIFGNPIKFSQVVMNLVSNAIDSYGDVDGTTDGRDVTVILRREGAYAELTIKDAGCGIQAEDVERIFEPFFTTKPASSGVGIGLATVQDIIKKDFVGSVRVESTVGRGSEFIVLFPVQVARPATPEHETVST